MHQLIIAAAKYLPEQIILDKIAELTAKIKANREDKKNRGELAFYCALWSIRIGDEGKSFQESINETEFAMGIMKNFKPTN